LTRHTLAALGVLLLAACGGVAEQEVPAPFGNQGGNRGADAPSGNGAGPGSSQGGCTRAACGTGGGSAAGGATGVAGTGVGGTGVGGTSVGGSGGVGIVYDPAELRYDFATDLEGFAVNYYCTSPNVCMALPMPTADAGAEPEFVTWAHDPAAGVTAPGSARLEIQFEGSGYVNFALYVPSLYLTNKEVKVFVRLDSGPATNAKLYLKSGFAYIYADSGAVPLEAGVWVQLAFPTAAPSYAAGVFEPDDVREMGIEISASPASLTPTIVHIDYLEY
jgi:hypothetical protein